MNQSRKISTGEGKGVEVGRDDGDGTTMKMIEAASVGEDLSQDRESEIERRDIGIIDIMSDRGHGHGREIGGEGREVAIADGTMSRREGGVIIMSHHEVEGKMRGEDREVAAGHGRHITGDDIETTDEKSGPSVFLSL